MSRRPEEFDRRRRELLRRATVYTWGFFSIAVTLAVGGSALVAWLLSRSGLPFLRTWLIIISLVVLPSLIGLVVRGVRERSQLNRAAQARIQGNGDDGERWPTNED